MNSAAAEYYGIAALLQPSFGKRKKNKKKLVQKENWLPDKSFIKNEEIGKNGETIKIIKYSEILRKNSLQI